MNRRKESPVRRVSQTTGKVSWVARYTNREGKRVSGGAFVKQGPCKGADPLEGLCCAQHRIWHMQALDAATTRTGAPVTVSEYAVSWMRTHPRSERTAQTNEHRLQQLIGPFTARQVQREKRDQAKRPRPKPRTGVVVEGRSLGDWPLAELRYRHMLLLVDVLLVDQGRAAEGARGLMRVLSAMFNDARKDDLCESNPCHGLVIRSKDPRVSKAPRAARVVSFEQMHALAAAAGEHEPAVRVAADCGLRLGELLGLAAEDVKLRGCDECEVQGPHIHVCRTAHDGVVTLGTKRERMRDVLEGGRVVPLPPATAALLLELPRRISGPMFFTERGKVWREDNFRTDVWNPARVASGVEASPHDFRHSWISHLRAAGVDRADLAQMSGHDVSVADSVYTHALGRSYDDARQAVGE